MLISSTDSYFQNPYYGFLEEPIFFLLALKRNLDELRFSCVKTKTNSHFAVKFAERSYERSNNYFSVYLMNHIF